MESKYITDTCTCSAEIIEHTEYEYVCTHNILHVALTWIWILVLIVDGSCSELLFKW